MPVEPDTQQRIDELEARVMELRLKTLEEQAKDFESRLRRLEETATKLNTINALVWGGGALAAINLLLAITHITAG